MTHLSDPQLVEIHLIIILFCVEEVSKALNGLVDGNTDRHRSKSVTLLPTSLTIAFKFVPKNTLKIPPPLANPFENRTVQLFNEQHL